jgi:hypothetical protein
MAKGENGIMNQAEGCHPKSLTVLHERLWHLWPSNQSHSDQFCYLIYLFIYLFIKTS